MGLVRAEIELVNASDISFAEAGVIEESKIRKMKVLALVNSGSIMMAINEAVKGQLGLKTKDRRPSLLADGTVTELDVVGPIEIRFKNRFSTTNALVLPEINVETQNFASLLGAIPMEEMDVLIHPNREELIINPDHPNKPQMVLK